MIEKLRKKFIIISISSVFMVLAIIVAAMNMGNYAQIGNHANEILEVLSQNDGYFPKPDKNSDKRDLPSKMSPEAPFSTRFFTVKQDRKMGIISIDTGKVAATTTSEAVEYVKEVMKKGKTKGSIGSYKYEIIAKDYGELFIFVDCSRDFEMFYAFLLNSFGIFIIGLLGISVLILLFSKKAIAPVAEAYEKQKQFITDASHELKTPLAIIASNTEVLEIEHGESQWTKSTIKQVGRLANLVSSLVSLTRMDEQGNSFEMMTFCLSDAVMETAEPFIELCRSQSKLLILSIDENLSYYGNEEAIRQLVEILLDNALKYASLNNEIKLSVKKKGKKYYIAISNMAANLSGGDLNLLFERFYRPDVSRSSDTGGYGIGLSIAQAIVLKHKGKITADNINGDSIIITVVL